MGYTTLRPTSITPKAHELAKAERAKASPKPLNLARFRAFFVYKNFTHFYKKHLDKL